MSAKFTFLAWDTPINNAPLKLTLLQLADNSDDNGFSFYSISKMANRCGMSDRTFMRKISELEALNILKVERRPNRPSLYTLLGDEMGVTLCHLQEVVGVTESHPGVTESHLVSDRESHDPNNDPNIYPKSTIGDKSPQVPLQEILNAYHDILSAMPKVQVYTEKRKAMVRTFFKKRSAEQKKNGLSFVIENVISYFKYIAEHCQWMTEARPNSNGGMWKVKNFDYVMKEDCYVAVKEQRHDDIKVV